MTVSQTVTVVLAQPVGGNPGGQGEDFGKSSPVGLLLLVLFGIAVTLLVRSMSKHLKKLPTTFDENRAAVAAPKRSRTSAGASKGSASDPESTEDSAEAASVDAVGEADEDGTTNPTTDGAGASGVGEDDDRTRAER